MDAETRAFLEELRAELKREFVAIDTRFATLDAEMRDRFDGVDRKLDAHDRRFNILADGLIRLERRFDGLDAGQERQTREIARLAARLDAFK